MEQAREFKVVAPRHLVANGLYNIFNDTKKWRIWCGSCGYVWDERRPVEYTVSAVCPSCRMLNQWDYQKFMQDYEEWQKRDGL